MCENAICTLNGTQDEKIQWICKIKKSDSPKIKELVILDLSLIKAYCEDINKMFS